MTIKTPESTQHSFVKGNEFRISAWVLGIVFVAGGLYVSHNLTSETTTTQGNQLSSNTKDITILQQNSIALGKSTSRHDSQIDYLKREVSELKRSDAIFEQKLTNIEDKTNEISDDVKLLLRAK